MNLHAQKPGASLRLAKQLHAFHKSVLHKLCRPRRRSSLRVRFGVLPHVFVLVPAKQRNLVDRVAFGRTLAEQVELWQNKFKRTTDGDSVTQMLQATAIRISSRITDPKVLRHTLKPIRHLRSLLTRLSTTAIVRLRNRVRTLFLALAIGSSMPGTASSGSV